MSFTINSSAMVDVQPTTDKTPLPWAESRPRHQEDRVAQEQQGLGAQWLDLIQGKCPWGSNHYSCMISKIDDHAMTNIHILAT